MKRIPLTQGKFALVDDEDFERLNKVKWYCSKNGYAVRSAKKPNSEWTVLRMVHEIIGKPPRGFLVDHIDGNKLNNRKSNLRFCTPSQNLMNKGKPESNTSGYKGVSWDKVNKKWKAEIKVNGKSKTLGRFLTPKIAYKIYCEACIYYHKEFARLK